MNIRDLLKFSADGFGPGAALTSVTRHHAVVTRPMHKMKGRTRVGFKHRTFRPEHLHADASPSDLASHHLFEEPSSTDVTIRNWRSKRVLESGMRRNMDPFEIGAATSRPVTGPCGCTLQLGDSVVVEGVGRGRIVQRRDRMLTVHMNNGKTKHIDQKFVHALKSA